MPRPPFFYDSSFEQSSNPEDWERIIYRVEPEHPIVPAWPRLNPRIHEIIDASPALKKGWRSIDVLRIGYISDDNFPTPVTISVIMERDVDPQYWQVEERQIKELLLDYQLTDVEVKFEQGDVYPCAFQTMRPSVYSCQDRYPDGYPQRAMMGSDFGPKVDLTLKPGEDAVYGVSGTLGGYIDLMRHNGTVKKLGLTSYHCVRYGIPGWPGTEKSANNLGMNIVPEEHDLQMIDDKGLPIGSPAGRAMRFQAPSQRAHKKAVHSIDCNLETVEQHLEQSQNPKKLQQCINEYRADRERKTKYFEQGDQNLGNLFMCSGLKERTSTNGRLDVAFLNVRPGKLGSNTVPKESEWGNGFTPSMTVKRNGKKLNGIKACENEYRTLFKVGSAMGPSSGKFNSIKSDLHMSWDGKLEMSFSTEYCFVSDALRSRGVDHGDPGSFVFTYDNEWVGVVLGGSVRRMSQVTPVCYVTDAQAILDWVGKIKNKDGEHYAARLSAD